MKRYVYNETAFELITNEQQSYWLGFLYADGYIHSKKNLIEINLALKDEIHLKKFKDYISPLKPILYFNNNGYKKNSPAVKFAIWNKKIRNDLISLGCIPRKTFSLEFPTKNKISNDLIHHFIRGYFDGDGCVGIYSYNNVKQYLFQLDSSLKFLTECQKIFNHSHFRCKIKPHSTIFRLASSGKKNVFNIGEYLYKDSTIFLERKRNIFDKIYV
jgi:hypothetical protein